MILEENFDDFQIETALTGDLGLEKVQGWNSEGVLYQLKYILMDLNMPEKDGIQASQEIRQFLEDQLVETDLKIYLHTAQESAIYDHKIMRLFDGVASKPLRVDNLEKLLKS